MTCHGPSPPSRARTHCVSLHCPPRGCDKMIVFCAFNRHGPRSARPAERAKDRQADEFASIGIWLVDGAAEASIA